MKQKFKFTEVCRVRKIHAAFFCLFFSGMIHAQSSSIWFAGQLAIRKKNWEWLLNQNRISMFVHIRIGKQQVINLGYTWLQQPLGNFNLLHTGFQQNLIT